MSSRKSTIHHRKPCMHCRHLLGGIAILTAALFLPVSRAAAAEAALPPYQEVFDLIATNAAGMTEAELQKVAVEGLLSRIRNRAWVVGTNGTAGQGTGEGDTMPVAVTAVFDDNYGYIRIGRVTSELPAQFAAALTSLARTNQLKGLALDLRFASGTDFAAAGEVASQFLNSEQKLFEWSGGVASSRARTNAFRAPVVVLVNQFTSGGAEAIAAVLRDADIALLIGTNTAGRASTTRDFPLSNGQTLRIATSPLKLPGGEEVFSLKPDILVEVSAEDERAFLADAYRAIPRNGEGQGTNVASVTITNRPPRRRINEAELVRMSREGIDPELEAARTPRPAQPAKQVITDPKLARAIDLLKALAVVRHTRF